MLLMKSIKPQRLNDSVMRLELLNQMRSTGNAIKKDFERTTATWEHKPKFEVLVSLTGPGPVVLVATDDQIYRFVDEGTRPHLIWAGYYTGRSRAKVLAFPGTFTAKTVPGVIDSRSGARGGETVYTPYVRHPGTGARNFDETIARSWTAKFKRDMEDAMRRAAAKSGHGI